MPTAQITDRTAYIARSLVPPDGSIFNNGTLSTLRVSSPQHYMVSVPIVASAGTCVGWRNPHTGSILVSGVTVVWSTAGTGTFDVGTGTAGTGASNIFIDGGAMASLISKSVSTGVVSTIGSVGVTPALEGALVRGNGTVADSVTITMNEGTTSTAVGAMIFEVTVI